MTRRSSVALPGPLICAVSHRHSLDPDEDSSFDTLVAWARAAAHGGVDIIQIRERDVDAGALADLVRDIVAVTAGTGARVIVNERTDVALAAGAAGVHLRSTSPAASRIRGMVPPEFLIGRSVHGLEEAVFHQRDGGCDYLTFGTVFPTASKPRAHEVAGLSVLREVVHAVRLPVLAIGGITASNAGDVARAGARGIAGIGLFVSSWAGDERDESGAMSTGLPDLVKALRGCFTPSAPPEPVQMPGPDRHC